MASKYLSILLQKDGLSFLVTKDNEIIANQYFAFEKGISDVENVKKILSDDLYFNQKYDQVKLTHLSKKFILVPNEYYRNDKDYGKWLGFNADIDQNDFTTLENITIADAVLIDAFDDEMMSLFQDKFGLIQLNHAAGLFLNSLVVETDESQLFVNFHSKTFEIAAFQNQTLLLYNQFDYLTKEDIVYHLLNIIRQLDWDSNTTLLYYYGLQNNEESLKMMLNYIRHVIPATSDVYRMQHFTLLENLSEND